MRSKMTSKSQGNELQQLRLDEHTRIMQTELHVKYTEVASVSSTSREVRLPRETAEGSADLQSLLVDSAISRISFNLPAQVMRVTELQRDQSSQISTLQSELQRLEEHKRKVLERSAELREELESAKRKTYLLEEDSGQKAKRCHQLKHDILNLIKDNEGARRTLSTKRLELHTLKSKLTRYTQRLDEYTTSITTTTDTSDSVQTDIKDAEARLAKLKEKREHMQQNPEETDRICCGAVERELKDKISQLNTESDELSEVLKQLQEKVDSTRDKQQHVKQATAVLHKRNAAQLIRLKRQVKEQHLRHRQWSEQSRLLQQNVASLNQKLASA